MSDTETDKGPEVLGKGRGKDVRGRSRIRREVGGAARSASKRMRHSSGGDADTDIDTDVVLDTLLGCFRRDNTLLDRFMERLLLLPDVQTKIAGYATEKVLTESTDKADSDTMKILNNSVKELTTAVNKLQSELASSTKKCSSLQEKCDDLEQYSRRTNIIISNVPVNNNIALETQVCNILNGYVTPPIEPTDIDRTHRIYRKASSQTSDKPPDIIVKFLSYRTKASVLTKDPMEKLREDNNHRIDKRKVFISEDLTKNRKTLFFSTRQLKKKKLIKDTFTRDGRIVVKIRVNNDIKTWNITKESDLMSLCAKYKLPYIKPNTNERPRIDDEGADPSSQTLSASMDTDPPPSQPMSPSLLSSGNQINAHPGVSTW